MLMSTHSPGGNQSGRDVPCRKHSLRFEPEAGAMREERPFLIPAEFALDERFGFGPGRRLQLLHVPEHDAEGDHHDGEAHDHDAEGDDDDRGRVDDDRTRGHDHHGRGDHDHGRRCDDHRAPPGPGAAWQPLKLSV